MISLSLLQVGMQSSGCGSPRPRRIPISKAWNTTTTGSTILSSAVAVETVRIPSLTESEDNQQINSALSLSLRPSPSYQCQLRHHG